MLDDDNKHFAYEFLRDREGYHTQKENAATAVFLVETSLFGAFIATNANSRFTDTVSNHHGVFVVVIAFVWCLLHLYLRWQLRNRRVAALQVATVLLALTDHLSDSTTSPENECEGEAEPPCAFLDFFIPRPASTVVGDMGIKQYPAWYRTRYLAAQKKNRGANFGEIFPTYGSIVMLVTSLTYVLLQ